MICENFVRGVYVSDDVELITKVMNNFHFLTHPLDDLVGNDERMIMVRPII